MLFSSSLIHCLVYLQSMHNIVFIIVACKSIMKLSLLPVVANWFVQTGMKMSNCSEHTCVCICILARNISEQGTAWRMDIMTS